MNRGNIKKMYFKDTSFANLMTGRIYNILLIASKYDAFMLEGDGRIDELIFNEYTSLNLRSGSSLNRSRKEASSLSFAASSSGMD